MKTKIIKSILVPSLGILSAAVVTPITISSCAKQAQVPVESVRLNEATNANPIVLRKNEVRDLTTTIFPNNATDKNLDWKSSDRDIARVVEVDNQTAKIITGNEAGEATITVSTSDGKIRNSYKIVVNPTFSDIIPQNGSSIELNEGETEYLSQEWNDTTITWKSNDETIAVIDKGNKIKALKQGKAIITGINEDGDVVVTFEATVKSVPAESIQPGSVESVQLDKNELVLIANEEGKLKEQLTATVLPKNATNKNVTWSSSNPSVVTVDQNGLVTVVADGSATITVTTEDGGYTDTCQVNVGLIQLEVQLDKDDMELTVGETGQLTATISPADATNKNVTWSSSDEKVATVDKNGKVIAIRTGFTIITVTTEDGGHKDDCIVRVIAKPESVQLDPQSIQLDKKELKLVEGKSEQLTATVLSENAANKKVTWKSSDEEVAKVDQKGLVSAVAEGIATITVTTEDGSKTATCEIKVIAPTFVVVGVDARHISDLTKNKNITWSSSDDSIATVEKNGDGIIVHPHAPGDVTIIAKNSNGEIAGVLQYRVTPKKGN